MAVVYYFDQRDLEAALGKAIVESIFDDEECGKVEDYAVTACLAYGTSECNSFLRVNNDVPLPLDPVPDEVKFAAIDFGCAYATRRRPDKVRAMGEAPWTTFHEHAVAKMKRYADTLQRLPRSVNVPSNVGATVASTDTRLTSSSCSSTERIRQWDDMGDF